MRPATAPTIPGAAPSARRQKFASVSPLVDGAKASSASGSPEGLGALPAPAAGVARIPSPSQTTPLALPGRRRLTSSAGGPLRLGGTPCRSQAGAVRGCSLPTSCAVSAPTSNTTRTTTDFRINTKHLRTTGSGPEDQFAQLAAGPKDRIHLFNRKDHT